MRNPKFNQNDYWIDRHQKLRGDPRSVGNLGRSKEENLLGERRLIEGISWIVQEFAETDKVLDIGCGYGRVASVFIDRGLDYTGIDVAPAAIDAARVREPRGNYLIGSALEILPKLVKQNARFNLICGLYVLVHFVEDEDWLKLLNLLADCLADDGALIIADEFSERSDRPVAHVHKRPLQAYIGSLENLHLKRDTNFKTKLVDEWRYGGSPPPFEMFRRSDCC
jgi:SAM-dependent methyltransferase